jgi:hypothetical protein
MITVMFGTAFAIGEGDFIPCEPCGVRRIPSGGNGTSARKGAKNLAESNEASARKGAKNLAESNEASA